MTLDDVLRAPLPGRIDDVVERLQAIEEALPEKDGVRAFTALYRAVTEVVDERVRPGTFAELAVHQAGRRRLREPLPARPACACARAETAASGVGGAVRGALAPRDRPDPVALAGMNAHINRDLPLALVEDLPCARRRADAHLPAARRLPRDRSPARRDRGAGGADFATGLVGWADEALGELDNVVAMGNVRRARARGVGERRTLGAASRCPVRRRALRRHARPARRPGSKGLLRRVA